MKGQFSFPELVFTSPGTYTYTIKELTPSSEQWETDERVYRVVITVVDTGGGVLAASASYPDNWPAFINTYRHPKPPRDVCKCFYKLPFPMLYFNPPQKPEFDGLMENSPYVFDWWGTIREWFEGE